MLREKKYITTFSLQWNSDRVWLVCLLLTYSYLIYIAYVESSTFTFHQSRFTNFFRYLSHVIRSLLEWIGIFDFFTRDNVFVLDVKLYSLSSFCQEVSFRIFFNDLFNIVEAFKFFTKKLSVLCFSYPNVANAFSLFDWEGEITRLLLKSSVVTLIATAGSLKATEDGIHSFT